MLVVQWNIVGLKRNVEEDNIDAALVCEDRLMEDTRTINEEKKKFKL